MKKIILALMLVAALALALPCSMPSTPAAQAQGDEEYIMVSNVAAHPYWLDAQWGGEDAAEELGVKWTYVGPADFNTPEQVTTLEQIIARKPAGIIVAALEPDALTPAIDRAIAAGIPVVTVDTDAPNSKRMTYLGTDNYQAGRVMGERIAEVLGGEGKVGIATVPGQFNLEERIRGIKDVFAEKYPDLEIVAIVDDKNDDSATADAVVAMMQAHPDIDLVTSMNAVGAGVAAALRQTGQVGKVKAVVFDITDPILDGVADGALDSTIVQRTYMMTYVGVHLLYRYNHPSEYLGNWLNAGIGVLPNIVDTGVMVVTADQVDVFRAK